MKKIYGHAKPNLDSLSMRVQIGLSMSVQINLYSKVPEIYDSVALCGTVKKPYTVNWSIVSGKH